MSDPAFLSATRMAAEIQAGRLTSTELIERLLARIEAYDDKLHAFIAVYAEEARMAAAAADQAIRSGHAVGPFHGVPVALKDIIDMEGRITTGGSKAWADRVSPVTATLARRLIAAGMIVIGKTHTVEFAMGGWGTNTHMGTPWNPWDLEVPRTPGGSSAGSGVSVAAGLAPWALGTDTGGSVRLPAAWCGLAGLKTTIGRISTFGVLPLATTLDTPGPICRTVEDAAHLYMAMAGPDPHDSLTLRHPIEDPLPSLKLGVAGMRLARLPEAERDGVDAEVLAAYDASLEVLADLGANIVDVDLPLGFADFAAATGRIIGAEGYSFVGELVDDDSLPIDPNVRPRIWIGKDMSARDYLLALREKEKVKCDFAVALAGVEALLTPSTMTAAIPVDEVDETGTPAYFTRAFNLLDACALSLPNGFTSGGLPISLQIACRSYDETTALRIGWAYEQVAGFAGRVPSGLEA
jgi:aspartyl-tRNA(Asn)/glutamyl-tRNA(Gln) amidotransferase subunit A